VDFEPVAYIDRTRRLYAIECWIAIAGLAIYLAITEIGPRFWRLQAGPAGSADGASS